MILPQIPQFTGNNDKDLNILIDYQYQLSRFLIEAITNGGWSVGSFTERKTLSTGDTLADTQDTLATLMSKLLDMQILSE